jgi:hypothetical protein
MIHSISKRAGEYLNVYITLFHDLVYEYANSSFRESDLHSSRPVSYLITTVSAVPSIARSEACPHRAVYAVSPMSLAGRPISAPAAWELVEDEYCAVLKRRSGQVSHGFRSRTSVERREWMKAAVLTLSMATSLRAVVAIESALCLGQ